MPIHTPEQIAELNEIVNTIEARAQALIESYVAQNYGSPTAEEFAHQGFCRRVSTLRHCICTIYSALPPEFHGLPGPALRETITIHLQAFVFNVYGALDNLALVWVHERDVRLANGRPLPSGRIGLTKDKDRVRQSLPAKFRTRLEECDPWFEYLEAFRHSLGHRIPLYIPPFTIDPANVERYESIVTEARQAIARYDFDAHRRLESERDALCKFRPWMQHSLQTNGKPMAFHSQVLADFATVEMLGQQMLDALNGP